jgi:hypothetical protein
VRKALLPTGSVLSVNQAAAQLGLSEAEVEERIADRSLLGIEILDLYNSWYVIPVFQFDGVNHIPGFHDLWDRLDPECRVERICQFFSHEKFADSGQCIASVLRTKPSEEVIQAIHTQADEFKLWCAENLNDIEMSGQEMPYAVGPDGFDDMVTSTVVTSSKHWVSQGVSLLLAVLKLFGALAFVGIAGFFFPLIAYAVFKRKQWVFLTDLGGVAFLGSAVAFAGYVGLGACAWLGDFPHIFS